MTNPDQFRNQYLLTSADRPGKYEAWPDEYIDENLILYSHPDLPVRSASKNQTTITSIGYILDPLSPKKSNFEILSQLASDLNADGDPFEEINHLGGRYVLIIDHPENQLLVPDAGALRPIMYGRIGDDLVITSSPKLSLAWFDTEQVMNKQKENYIPRIGWRVGRGTDDDRLTRVLANHFLDLEKQSQSRIPYSPPSTIKSIKYSSELLEGTLRAIVERFENPQMWISGGLDSRMLIAASKPISDQCQYIVFNRNDVKETDVSIAQQLQVELDIDVTTADLGPISASFKNKIDSNFCSPRYDNTLPNVEWTGNNQSENGIVISGIVSEVGRTFYEHPTKELSAELCHTLAHLPQTEYSYRELNNWLDCAKRYEKESGINPYDLFYWEQKISNWGARAGRELDLVSELSAPFANRELLHTILQTPREDRRPPKYTTSRRIIQNCWPECLEVPINPNKTLTDKMMSYIKSRSQTNLLHYKIKEAYYTAKY
ncbi:hypothetical protein [Natronosalvus halobius]|uniref:hypothetical protein n=1 Tax=Natronosalvus halobius TaxID=2953746 RepID=UPI00209FE5E8|nr:hypothetical protein [Natronosalvus halobius]USZ71474.1 hypothetical protein NGM15_15620 [Natronosalvus halobius]